MLNEITVFAVFLTGLLGGIHCAGMCGGVVSALSLSAKNNEQKLVFHTSRSDNLMANMRVSQRSSTPIMTVLLYNTGRILTYVTLGALVASIGSVAWLFQTLLPVQKVAFAVTNLLLIAMGLYVLGFKAVSHWIESRGNIIWRRIQPFATMRLSRQGGFNALITGGFWGLVPCGLVYAVLSAALVSGSTFNGALLMAAFGLGTLPNLMLLGLSGQWLARLTRNRHLRRVSGLVILSFGFVGLLHLGMLSTIQSTITGAF